MSAGSQDRRWDHATLVGELTARGFDREQETAADLFGLVLDMAR